MKPNEALQRIGSVAAQKDLAVLRADIQEGIDSANRGELQDGAAFCAELDDYIHELTGLRP